MTASRINPTAPTYEPRNKQGGTMGQKKRKGRQAKDMSFKEIMAEITKGLEELVNSR